MGDKSPKDKNKGSKQKQAVQDKKAKVAQASVELKSSKTPAKKR